MFALLAGRASASTPNAADPEVESRAGSFCSWMHCAATDAANALDPAPQIPICGASVTKGIFGKRSPKTIRSAFASAASTDGIPLPSGIIASISPALIFASSIAPSIAAAMSGADSHRSTPTVSMHAHWLAANPASSAKALTPRLCALSNPSVIKIAPPSPRTVPAARGSNGRTAATPSAPTGTAAKRFAKVWRRSPM